MCHEEKWIVVFTEGIRIVTEITASVCHSFIIMLSPADILAGLLALLQGHFGSGEGPPKRFDHNHAEFESHFKFVVL